MKWIGLDTVLEVYRRIIKATGGKYGVRDKNLLESSLMAPLATYGGVDLYPDIFTKVAALLYGIANNHPFIDGNKRVAFAVAITVLESNGLTFEATQEEIVSLMLNVARGEIGIPAISAWLEAHN